MNRIFNTVSQFFCFVIFLAIMSSSAIANNMTLTVGSIESPAGTEVAVPLRVTQAVRLGALQMDVLFDEQVLDFRSASPNSFEDPITIDQHVVEPGRLRLVMNTSASASISGDHDLLTLNFQVIGSVGSQSKVALEAIEAWDNIGPDAIPAVMFEIGRAHV
jgi:hypothetical protein